ncbi:MAG: hypothetical protein WAN48_09710 [Actinomycetes bacterium]
MAAGDLYGVMLRRAAPWALAASAVCVVVLTASSGLRALAGAVVGVLIVVGFYALDVVVLRLMKGADPAATVAAVLAEYTVKIVILAVLVWQLRDSTAIDMGALAMTVVVTTVTWVVALTVVAMRSRSFTLDPVAPGRAPGTGEAPGPGSESDPEHGEESDDNLGRTGRNPSQS